MQSATSHLQDCSAEAKYGPNCEHLYNIVDFRDEDITISEQNSTLCSAGWCYFEIHSERQLSIRVERGLVYFKQGNAPTLDDWDTVSGVNQTYALGSTGLRVVLGVESGRPFQLVVSTPPGGLDPNVLVGIILGGLAGLALLVVLGCVIHKRCNKRLEYHEV